MAIRLTMEPLIDRVRLMINDPPGATQQFTEQQIQDTLDDWRSDVRYEQLTPAPSIVNTTNSDAGPADFVWADYYSLYHWWEGDVVIQDGHFIVLTPLTSDYVVGHWQFELNVFTQGVVPGQYPPLFATGKIYDLNGACADLMDMWAAFYARSFNFSADGRSFSRGMIAPALMKQAEAFRRKARPRDMQAVRNDLTRVSHAEQAPILGANPNAIEGR